MAKSGRRVRRRFSEEFMAGAVRLFEINAGIVTYTSAWNPAFGQPFKAALNKLPKEHRLNLGLAVSDGCFDVRFGNHPPKVRLHAKDLSLAAFLIRLLARLQAVGTAPAIDYDEYAKVLR